MEVLAQRAPPGAEEPDTDPTFDPEGDAQRIKQETAARAAASLEKAAKAGVRKKPKTEIADVCPRKQCPALPGSPPMPTAAPSPFLQLFLCHAPCLCNLTN